MKNRKSAVIITALIIILAIALSAMLHSDTNKRKNLSQSEISSSLEMSKVTDNGVKALLDDSASGLRSNTKLISKTGIDVASIVERAASMGIGFIFVIIIIAVLIISFVFRLMRSFISLFGFGRAFIDTDLFVGDSFGGADRK